MSATVASAAKPHIRLSSDPRFARAVVCGSPERAQMIAGFLEGTQALAKNREYHSYLGKSGGQDIVVMSHGVGASGAAIGFQELIDVGARAIIRVGTAGGLYDETRIGDVVVPTAAARNDGVTARMVPAGFPAVPSFDLTTSLIAEVAARGAPVRSGIALTSDLFYPGPMPSDLEENRRAGALAVEMECSALFVIAGLRGVRAAAALILDGNPLKWAEGAYDPDPARLQKSVEACAQAAIAALARADLAMPLRSAPTA